MSESASTRDIVLLLADRNMEAAIGGVLERHQALGIRRIDYAIRVHTENDPGCCLRAHEFLRPFCRRYSKALVVFDREGSGKENLPRTTIEKQIEQSLIASGWSDDRARVIVIDPELEAWVWSDSPKVDDSLGWTARKPDVREWLRQRNFNIADNGKPERPKEAMEAALRSVRKARSSAIYAELAAQVSLRRCADPAFNKLKTTLQQWFPQNSP